MKRNYPILFLLLLLAVGCAKEEMTPRPDPVDNSNAPAEDQAPTQNTFATLLSHGQDRFLRVDGQYDWLIVNPAAAAAFPDDTRVLATLEESSESTFDKTLYSSAVSVILMEAVETAYTAARDSGTTAPDNAYFGTPLQIIFDWITTAEAGYLTLHYRILQSGAVKHRFELRPYGTDYDYALFHDSQEDAGEDPGEGVVCFRLSPEPQAAEGETTRIRLHYLDFSGKVKTLVLVYRNGI